MASRTTRTEKTVNLMYRCRSCKSARRITVKKIYTRTTYDEGYYPTDHKTTYYKDDQSQWIETCSCGFVMQYKEIKGFHSDKHKCGARCLNAIGPNCECSCSGENHGLNHQNA